MNFPIAFTKMSGTGNDFIIIDHRKPFIAEADRSAFAKAVCRRMFSVGADGLILIEDAHNADFKWDFYNADGSVAEMCGNGARCAARFAHKHGIAPAKMSFVTIAGVIEARILNNNAVKIKLTLPTNITLAQEVEVDGDTKKVHSINTGVPHTVHFVDSASATPVCEWGRQIRHHKIFQPAGTNVNFVYLDDDEINVRTYERGVEDETMACGTGAVASAIISALHGRVASPVKVRTSGGEYLKIHFVLLDEPADGRGPASENRHEQRIAEVFLEGPANIVYEGLLQKDVF